MSLRIFGAGQWHARLAELEGVRPTHEYRKGDPQGVSTKFRCEHDGWVLHATSDRSLEMHEQLELLWSVVEQHKRVFAECIADADHADVCLGLLSDDSGGLVGIPPAALRLIRELDVGVTLNFDMGAVIGDDA